MGNQPSWVGRESQRGHHLKGTLQHGRGNSHWTATVRHRNINATHGQDIEQTLTPTTNTPQSEREKGGGRKRERREKRGLD